MSRPMPLRRTNCGQMRGKKQKHCLPEELEAGDCWVGLSLAQLSGLILTGRVGKHTDSLGLCRKKDLRTGNPG